MIERHHLATGGRVVGASFQPKAPWPTAGKNRESGRRCVICSAKPNRCKPASARITASYSPSSSFRNRVSRLPRMSFTRSPGRTRSSCARRRMLLVPTTLPSGRASSEGCFRQIETSPTGARCGTAAGQRPGCRVVGTSLRLWTPKSQRPVSNSRSISLTKTPSPPIDSIGPGCRSPWVVIGVINVTPTSFSAQHPFGLPSSQCELLRVPRRRDMAVVGEIYG